MLRLVLDFKMASGFSSLCIATGNHRY